MNKIVRVLYGMLFFVNARSQTTDSWQQVQPSGSPATAREGAAGFSIGNKGYIGTGAVFEGLKKDFWEFDPANNTWTQKADFGGTARFYATGLSIDNKGYIGTGNDGSPNWRNDFWEYDPTTNFWTQKANFGGKPTWGATSFSINGKGYIGTGEYTRGLWEYDPATNSWTQKADFGGTGRTLAVGFSIGLKGYIGTGIDPTYNNDIWEYDPATNSWAQKGNFGGTARTAAVGFSIGPKGYIGLGYNNTQTENDFWEYDPALDKWTQRANFGGVPRVRATGLNVGGYGYIGFGALQDVSGHNITYNDWWKYAPYNVLPLRLITFAAGHAGKSNILEWTTAQEVNSIRFETERSINGSVFTKMGEVKSTGGQLQKSYRYIDLLPLKAINYYRLKIIDKDGSFTYSQIRTVNYTSGFGVIVMPNPVHRDLINLSVNSENTSDISITITNMNGKVLYANQFTSASAYFTRAIDVASFAKGMYLLKAVTGHEKKVIKFIKD